MMSPMSAEPLRPREICTVLFAKRQSGSSELHWSICIPYSTTTAKKLHAEEYSTGNFRYEEPIPDENLSVSPTVSLVVKLGDCTGKHTVEYIHGLLRAVPMQLPREDIDREPRFCSRVWWKEAVRTLHRHGVIHCPDVYELEREIYQYVALNDVSPSSAGRYKYFVSRRSV